MKTVKIIGLFICFLAHSIIMAQTVPGTLSYQGILMQSDGITPLADGPHSIVFKFYTVASGGTALAGLDRIVTVTTFKGLFTCVIGSGTAPNAPFSASEINQISSQQIYIGISVDGGSELTPRAQTTPTTYALQAQSTYTISDNAVTTIKILDGTIVNADISSSAAISDTKLATITTSGKVASTAISGLGSLAGLSAITSSQITDGAIATIDIADAAVTNSKLGADLDASKLTTGILPISRISDGTISNIKLGTDLDASKLTTGILPIGRVADGTISSAKISDGTIVNDDISASAAIVDSKLATISTAGKILGGAITSGTIGGTTSVSSSGSIRTTGEIRGGDEDFPGSVAVQGNNGVDYGTAIIAGDAYGVLGASASGGTRNWGVFGSASGTGTSNYGVYGVTSTAATNNYGIFGDASGATGKNWAGYFDDGNVYIKGQIGVGTTDPAFKLDVSQSITGGTPVARILNPANTSSADVVWIQGGSNTTSGAYLVSFIRPDGTLIGRIQQNSTTSVSYNTTSDYRLKDLYGLSNMGLSELMKLRVYDYKYKNDSSGKVIMGFIAQEVYSNFPQAVVPPSNERENDPTKNPWMMDYASLTPLITKSIQEQQEQLEELKSANEILEKRLAALESLLLKQNEINVEGKDD